MKGKERKLLLSLFLGLLGLLGLQYLMGWGAFTAMQRFSPTLSPDLELLFEAMLQVEDLPAGWHRLKGSIQTRPLPGGEGRFFWFNHASAKELTWVNISETVLVYGDEEAAGGGYQEQRDKFFPPQAKRWEENEALAFSHHADEIKVACLEGYLNGRHHYACRAVAQYGRVVIVVLGNVFEDQWLTMNEFRGVLEAADRRAVTAVKSEAQFSGSAILLKTLGRVMPALSGCIVTGGGARGPS